MGQWQHGRLTETFEGNNKPFLNPPLIDFESYLYQSNQENDKDEFDDGLVVDDDDVVDEFMELDLLDE